MNVEEGTLVLGKLIVKTRTNKRFEPLFILADNKWEEVDVKEFESSLPLKVPNDPDVENNGFVIAELATASNGYRRSEVKFEITPVRPAHVVITTKEVDSVRIAVETIDELVVPRWAGGATEIFILLSDDTLIGPFRVNRKKLRAPTPEKLQVRRSINMVAASVDGYFIGDRIDRLPIVRYYDSRPNDEIAMSVADFAASTLSNLDIDESDIQTTRSALRKLAGWLADQNEDIEPLDSEKIERTSEAFEDAVTARRLAQDVAKVLGGLPEVVEHMDRAIEEGRANAERGEQLRIEHQVKQERETFDNLLKQKTEVENELQKLRTLVENAQLEFETAEQAGRDRSEELRANVAVAVEEIIEGSRERLASSIIGQALASQAPTQSRQIEPAPVHEFLVRKASLTLLTSSAAVNKRIKTSAQQYGLHSIALQRMISAFRADLIPVTLGNGGPPSIDTAVDIAYSGRLARLPVAHDFLHPNDILGLHSGKPGSFRSNYQLLSNASEAAATGELVVVLEGINQAPTESYLVPWLQKQWKGTEVDGFEYNTNLKIAGTIATGVTSARLSPDLWGYAVAIDTATLPQRALSREYSQIELSEPDQPAPNITKDLLDDVEAQWPITDDVVQAGDRYARALSVFQNEDQVRRSVALCLLLPAAATSLSDLDYSDFVGGVAKNLSMSEELTLQYSGLARRLRMRLA
ncbi:putative nucleic acid-binding Zn-ribbon protein [Rhodococcus cercidiphylli]|nr:putative nucleic acid-binding Zn-ribbon protein [Rhodococcus cercidiphylli]